MTPSDSTGDHARPVGLADAAALAEFVGTHDVALAEFYTAGCSKCAAMEPVLGNVARATGVPVGLINPRDDPPLVERFDVQSVPLLVVFVDGDPVDRRAEGFVGADDLVAWLEEYTD
jgi:thioredoxin-like negative regulator of GroEL